MKWKKIKHITDKIEINELGAARHALSKYTLDVLYNNQSGFYEISINLDNSKKQLILKMHELVAIYFLNNGNELDSNQKVVFKNGDVTDYAWGNLEIVNKSQHTNFKGTKPRKELYVSYGDEIYC